MSAARFIDIDGRRYLWRDILRLRREPSLFSLD